MKRGLVALLSFPLIGFFVLVFFLLNSRPFSSSPGDTTFVINQGDGLSTIADRLYKNRLIRQPQVFMVQSYLLGLNNKLQAGGFRLSPSMTVKQIIVTLSSGGSHDFWLKILPGWRLEQVEMALDNKFSIPDSKEAYLFPDSYLIPDYYNLDQILALIDENFQKNFTKASQSATLKGKLSSSDILIIASLLEREAKLVADKQIVAGIILNRLAISMPLQIDATVQYARDSLPPKPDQYWLPVSKTNLSLKSDYNTYLSPGLPAGPICNPGFDSLFAVFHPTDSDYLYYISDNSGSMHYAKTLEEHNQHVADYLR
jgi:UPF0755 protein